MLTGDAAAQPLDVTAVRATLVAYRDAVRRHAGVLNRWNVYPVPDGDTGTNMARTLDATVEAMEAAAADLPATCAAISHGSLMGARGNSGVILSQLLRGFAGIVAGTAAAGGASARHLSDALHAASTSAYAAVVRPKEGTILTVAREAAEAAAAAVRSDEHISPADMLRTVRTAARAALARTPQQLPALAEAGVVDAGAAGFVLFFDAALNALDGEPVADLEELGDVESAVVDSADGGAARRRREGESSVADLRFEVMFFLDLADEHSDAFKAAWAEIGDSIAVVGGEGLWNCHIHTNDVGAAIEAALDAGGRPRDIRVTDLFDQIVHVDPLLAGPGVEAPVSAVVAVANGDGVARLLRSLGVARVVTGGQTMNPSTAELIEAAEAVVAATGATEVVILPNNANIIPVALQVHAFVTFTVSVVPTRSVTEALSALVVFDASQGSGWNADVMSAATNGVRTGEVTCAVRDASTAVGQVTEGDWIGLASGEGIVAIASTLTEAAVRLVEHVVEPDCELVTVLAGEGASHDTDTAIQDWLAQHRPEASVDWHVGGQPLYPYLFGAE